MTPLALITALALAQADDIKPAAPDQPSATIDVHTAPEHDTAADATGATINIVKPKAQNPNGSPQPPESQVKPTVKLDPHPTADRRRWSEGETRAFIASTVDVGYAYLRPRLSFGYGRPHFKWIGIDVNPLIQNSGVGAWGGVRLQSPIADLRIGAREFYSFQYSYLTPQSHYDRLALDTSYRGHATYTTFEAELSGGVSLGFAEISGLASVSYVTGVPKGMYVFETNLRVLVDPPMVYRGRIQVGFYPVPGHRNVILGPVVDVLDVPKRDELLVRAGFAIRVVLSRAFEMRGNFVPSVVSRDSLGVVHSDFTELGLRYRWASDEQPAPQ